MKTVSIINLGCKVNQYESDRIAAILSCSGFKVIFGLEKADIYALNTCAVTNEGERKSRNILTKLIKLNPQCQIYVSGCASQNNQANFENLSNVKYIIGTNNKDRIAEQICADNLKEYKYVSNIISNRTRGVLKCQDGCNNFCSYCLIPYLRGREVSVPLNILKNEISAMINSGVKEIVLTGINLSNYGKDFRDGTSMIDLAKLFEGLPVRYRFSSLEVNVVTEELIKYLASQPNYCEHFHLSMQSGSNNTLKHMNRHYTKEQYMQKVELINKYFPTCSITTDVIVGFPTETEEDFNESYETCKAVGFADMHIFTYSKRNGTVASKMKNVATNVKERAKKLSELAIECKRKNIEANFNKQCEVLIETHKNNYAVGHSKNYIKCYILDNQLNIQPNTIVKVNIKECYQDGAIAEIVEI